MKPFIEQRRERYIENMYQRLQMKIDTGFTYRRPNCSASEQVFCGRTCDFSTFSTLPMTSSYETGILKADLYRLLTFGGKPSILTVTYSVSKDFQKSFDALPENVKEMVGPDSIRVENHPEFIQVFILG